MPKKSDQSDDLELDQEQGTSPEPLTVEQLQAHLLELQTQLKEFSDANQELADQNQELMSHIEDITKEPDPEGDYRPVTIMIPSKTHGISKLTGKDEETGESYEYTEITITHQPSDSVHHKTEKFQIPLDCRAIVPFFVANALGDRCDVQEM